MADNTKKEKKSFFKGMKAELKKVIWPTSKQVSNKTIAIIVLVLVVAGIVVLLDLGLRWTTDKLIYGRFTNSVEVENTLEVQAEDSNEVSVETEAVNEVQTSEGDAESTAE